jgi:hypothetical protein
MSAALPVRPVPAAETQATMAAVAAPPAVDLPVLALSRLSPNSSPQVQILPQCKFSDISIS